MNKKTFFKHVAILFSLCFCSCFAFGGHSNEIIGIQTKKSNGDATDDKTKYTMYLGYGYDITSGPLYNTNKVFKNALPILDVDNSALKSKIKLIDAGKKTTYNHYSTQSRRDLTQHYGQEISGGTSIGAKISAVNVDLSASFNTATSTSFGKIQSETFSYYNLVHENVSVLYQLDSSKGEFGDYLSSGFLTDAHQVDSIDAAENMLTKYGTHLLTGYTMGGVLELTNYYAQNSSSYRKETQSDFEGQLEATFETANQGGNLGTDFSFSSTYGTVDNNKYSVSKYHANQYGGNAITGLTIDQIFKWRDPALGKQEYVYQDWIDSINDGIGLVVIGLPGGTEAIPLYQLLPNTTEYSTAKKYLLEAYLKVCSGKYSKYLSDTKDIGVSDISDPELSDKDPSVSISGIERYTSDGKGAYYYSYQSNDVKSSTMTIHPSAGQVIGINYEVNNLDGYSYEWVADSDIRDKIELDKSTGNFTVKDYASVGQGKIYCRLSSGGNLATVTVILQSNSFGGGDGSESNPYLISSKEQLLDLCQSLQNNDFKGKCFKLVNDIDFNQANLTTSIGNDNKPFEGVFDGNYHTISNWKINNLSDNNSIGLFGCLGASSKVSKLRVDNAKIVISDSSFDKDLLSVGILAGKSTGSINDCFIEKSSIQLELNGEKSKEVKCTYVGGLVGTFEGNSIESCKLYNNDIRLKTSSVQKAVIGGIVGYNSTNHTYIRRCSVQAFNNLKVINGLDKLDCTNDELKDTESTLRKVETYAGGIIGESDSSISIEDCYVNTSVYAENTSKDEKISNLNGEAIGSNFKIAHMFTHTGGFIGFLDVDAKGSSLDNNVIKKPSINVKANNGLDDKEWSFVVPIERYCQTGALVGREQNGSGTNKIKSQITASNILLLDQNSTVTNYVGNATKSPNISCITDLNDFRVDTNSYFIKTDATIDLKFKWPVQVTFSDEDGNTLADSTKIKKNFFVGEDFMVGGKIIAKIKFSGEGKEQDKETVEDLKDFYVNYSSYDKTKETPENSPYSIKVQATVNGSTISSSYDVTVSKAGMKGLIVKKAENVSDKTYFVGDPTPKDTVNIVLTYSDSTSKEINISDNNLKIDANDNLVLGQNKVLYTYKEGGTSVSGYVVYEAVERNVTGFKITKNPTKTTYFSVNSTIVLTGMEVKVSYDNDSDKIISYDDYKDDFELYYNQLHYGDNNEIKVCYYDYNYQTFNVTVSSTEVSEKVNQFIRLVNSINDTLSDEEKAEIISQCIELNDSISGVVDNAEYDAACKKLKTYKAEFDDYVSVQLADFRSKVTKCKNVTDYFELAKLIDDAQAKKKQLNYLSNNEEYKLICSDLDIIVKNYNDSIDSALKDFADLVSQCETKQVLKEWKSNLDRAFSKKVDLSYLENDETYQALCKRLDSVKSNYDATVKTELGKYDSAVKAAEDEKDSDRAATLLSKADTYRDELSYLSGTETYDAINARYDAVKARIDADASVKEFTDLVGTCEGTTDVDRLGQLLQQAEAMKGSLGGMKGNAAYDAACTRLAKVRAEYNDIVSKISDFADAAERCKTADSLEELYNAIKAAEQLKSGLGDVSGSEAYTAACRTLSDAKANYDATVKTINSDFKSATETSFGMVFGFAFFEIAGIFTLLGMAIVKFF